MTDITQFNGFPREGLQFLKALEANNTRAWFKARREDYVRYLRDPMLAFIVTLGKRLRTLSTGLIYDTRTNGAGSMMRINRDTRFRQDKTPYKTYLTAMFWEGPGKKTESPAFGFRFDMHGGGLMAGMHRFPPPMLTLYRQAVADDSLGEQLIGILDGIERAGDYTIGGSHYKRVPRGYDSDHPRADLLRYKALYAYSPPLDPALLTSPELIGVCFDHFRTMAPVQRWLVKVHQQTSPFVS